MKTRIGFVSNSSSSSFVIAKSALTEKQIKLILNNDQSDQCYKVDEYDCWNITEDEYYVKGSTFMDNYDMEEFLAKIGVAKNAIHWSE